MSSPAQASGPSRAWCDVRRALTTPGPKRRALLYEELASLLQAGIGLRGALASLGDRGARRAALVAVWTAQVERGEPLHEGMAGRPELFTPLETTMFRVGERSGNLVSALRTLAARLEGVQKTRSAFLARIAYPVVVLHVALMLPTLPLVLVPLGPGAYFGLVAAGLLVLWGIPALLTGIYLSRRMDPGFSRRVCRLPMVGAALHSGAVQRFAWTLGALQDAGEAADVSLAEAIEAADCGWFRSRADGALAGIREGGTMADAVRCLDAVPRDVAELVATGELSGTISESMARASTLYEEGQGRATQAAAVAAGGLLFAFAVGVVVIAVFTVFLRVYGPAFELSR